MRHQVFRSALLTHQEATGDTSLREQSREKKRKGLETSMLKKDILRSTFQPVTAMRQT